MNDNLSMQLNDDYDNDIKENILANKDIVFKLVSLLSQVGAQLDQLGLSK